MELTAEIVARLVTLGGVVRWMNDGVVASASTALAVFGRVGNEYVGVTYGLLYTVRTRKGRFPNR